MSKVILLCSHPARAQARQRALEEPLVNDVPLYRGGIMSDGTVAFDWLVEDGFVPMRMTIPEAQRFAADLQFMIQQALMRTADMNVESRFLVAKHPTRTDAIVVTVGCDSADFTSFEVDAVDAPYTICSLCDEDVKIGERVWQSALKVDENGFFAERLLPLIMLCDACAVPHPPGLSLVPTVEGR